MLGTRIFPIFLLAMRALQGHPNMSFVAKKTICNDVLKILHITCVNSPENVTAAISCGIVDFLVQAFQGLSHTERIDTVWQCNRNQLEEVLFSAQMPLGAPPH